MKSLRVRLLASLLVVLALAVLVLGGVTYRNVLGSTQELFDYQLRQMALTLREQGQVEPAQAQALADEELDFVVQIWSVDGRSIFASRRHESLPSRAVLGFADVRLERGETWRTYSVATSDRVIQVAQPLRIRERLAASAALRGVLPLVVLAPLLAAAVWWLVALSLAPLRRLASDVRRRDAAELSPVELGGLPEEVEPLVHALNALLLRVSESFETQRAFVSDAAHELRSPLTALKLQVQMLRRAPDEAAHNAALAALAEGVDRSARLVDQLLALARSERVAAVRPHEQLDLGEVAREALASVVPYAVSRGAELALEGGDEGTEGVRVTGDRPALTMLVRNLVDNAVRHGPAGMKVVVRVALQAARPDAHAGMRPGDAGKVAVLSVDDAGPGIPADERERVFDRFYRRESSGGDEGGTGLGLAIVRNVAAQHGASIELSDSALGGLRVDVRFPASGV